MGKEPDAIRREIETTREQMGETVEAIGYRTDVRSRAKASVRGAKDRIVSSIAGTRDSVVSSAQGARERTPDMEDIKQRGREAAGIAQQNPFGLAIGSVAVGFLAGLAIPETRSEHERFGPVADQVKDKALETGREAFDRGKEVAQQTAQSATETARSAGQDHAQELASSAQQRASEVDVGSASGPPTTSR